MISIQILRGIAALVVVFFHVGRKADFLGFIDGNFFDIGKYGVDLFFIISGFIMAYITHNKEVNLYSFVKKRIIRIIPVYWILTSVALAVFLISPSSVNSHMEPPGIINSYLLFPVEGKSMLLEVAWTLRYEFIFYFLFAVCLTTKHRYIYSISILSLIWIGSLFNHGNYYINFILSDYMMEFAFGIIAFLAFKYERKAISSAIALVVFIAALNFASENRVLVIGSASYIIFMLAISFENLLKGAIAKPLAYIGDSSYTLYLSHLFVVATAGISTKFIPIMNNPVLFIVVTVAASLVFSSIFYELIEKNVTRFLTKKKTVIVGNAA